jgi:hypothetical protein
MKTSGIAAIALAGIGAAWLLQSVRAGTDAAQAEAGAELAAKACAGCHPGAELDAVVARRVGDAAPAAALEGFLSGHHASDAGQRAALIRYLETRLAPRAP